MKAFFKAAAVLVFGLGVGGLAFWGFTKTALYQKLVRQEVGVVQEAVPVLYYNDPDVGPMMKPHTKIHFRTPYFDNTVVTNGDGFTGRDYPLQPTHYRIAIMGDSAVEAYGVDDTNRFPHVTEALVYSKSGGKLKVDFMGFGVSGWGNVQMYAAIKKYVLKYKPNEIWLTYLPTNDTGDNTPLMNGPPLGPTFVYKSDDSDEIVDVRFGYPDVPDALQAERQRRYGEYLKDTWGKWHAGLMPYYWSPEHNPQWDLIMSHTLQTLKLTKKLCDENHIKLALVYRVTGYDQSQANFDAYAKEAAAFLKRPLPMDRQLGVKRFRTAMEEMGIEFINMLDMKEEGISNKASEVEVSKHVAWAQFFSDIIIAKLGAPPASGGKK